MAQALPQDFACARIRGAARSAEVGAYLASILQLVLAIDDHRVPGIHAAAQARVFISGLRDGHGVNFGDVIVIHGVHVSALWAALDCGDGHHGKVALGIHQQMHVHELIGK